LLLLLLLFVVVVDVVVVVVVAGVATVRRTIRDDDLTSSFAVVSSFKSLSLYAYAYGQQKAIKHTHVCAQRRCTQ
jgi:hypothetical protein